MSINNNIGSKIKNFRHKLGLQAKKLAEQLNISPSYLNLIESGKRNIDGGLLLKICNELRIELSDLTSEKEINTNNSKIAITKFLKNKNINKFDLKIGPKIKAFRRQLGLQANKFSEKINISPSYLNLIESGKRNIDGDLLIKVSKELRVQLSDLTSKADVNLENDISNLLDDQLFEDLDILGPEVKDLVNTNPKIAKALIKLGDNFKQKDHDIVNKVENISGKKIDSRKTSFPGEVISDFLQDNKNYFPKLEKFADKIFEKVQVNNRTRYIALCEFLKSEYSIIVKDIIPEDGKPFSKIYHKNKKELLLSDYNTLETKNYMLHLKLPKKVLQKRLMNIYPNLIFPPMNQKDLHKLLC